jgi:hypothetical protein
MDHPTPVPEQPAMAVGPIQPWRELMRGQVEPEKLTTENPNDGHHALRFGIDNQGVCTGAANGYGG